MTGHTDYKELVKSHLPTDKDNAVSMRSLAILCGITERDIRHVIHALRNEGEYICAGVRGYWITEDPDELQRYYKTARRRALSTLASLKPMRQRLKAAGMRTE